MTDNSVRGRFVWHDLMTRNIPAAQAFYTKALGWTVQAMEGAGGYSMFVAPAGAIGGAGPLQSGAPHWLPHIATPDIQQTVGDVTRLGGSIKTPVTPVPGMGQFAILADPQGAVFSVYSSTKHNPETVPATGEFAWHELPTSDGKAALEFYRAVFGWDLNREFDMGPMGTYSIFGRNGRDLGGIFTKPPEMPVNAWVGYVRVTGVEKSVAAVTAAGGKVINGPMQVPGGEWIAQFLDPEGATFAVVSTTK